MEFIRTTTSCCTPQLEDVPELIHLIQSLLPAKEAAQTCILSKSWLNAWSTIPTLRFPRQSVMDLTYEQKRDHTKLIDGTLARYHRCNLPIQSFDLQFDIWNQKSASLANKWILSVASKKALKELSLSIWVGTDSFTLPDEIFSSANLNSIITSASDVTMTNPLWIPHNRVILCVSLRVLELRHLNISEDVLHNLLSSCSLLEKINLCCCNGFKTIKLKHLRCLRELEITSIEENDVLEIDDVPSLRLFHYNSLFHCWKKSLPFSMDSLGSVTYLDISGVVMDDAFFNMIKSKFPFLESLSLGMAFRGHESVVITSLSLKRLTLLLWADMTIDVQVYAPKLLFFFYDGGETVPSLSFPTIAPEQIKLRLNLPNAIDHSFFIKMREALNLSSKFDIDIIDCSNKTLVSLNTEVDDLRRSVLFPVTNVRQLSLATVSDECLWEHTRFFDAFFSICHPGYVKARHMFEGNKCFSRLMVKEMMEKKTTNLKDVELKNPCNGKWEDLTRSCKILSLDNRFVEFKLNWFSI